MSELDDVSVWRGPRFVLAVYVSIVLIAGVFGFVIGLARPKNLDPELFALVQLPPTPVGMALYGIGTVATVLGVLLLAVNYVGEKYDTERVDVDDREEG